MPASRIAIIGAGVTGITCARALVTAGHEVTIFEKSRGIGGRIATRRTPEGHCFDHGAASLQPAPEGPDEFTDHVLGTRAAKKWQAVRVSSPQNLTHIESVIVGVPQANSWLKALSAGLQIKQHLRVTGLVREAARWTVETDDQQTHTGFDKVICTVPGPQAADLLNSQRVLQSEIAATSMAPCWTLMVNFSSPLQLDFSLCEPNSGDVLRLIHQSAKPDRNSDQHCWVLQANPDWSTHYLELDRDLAAVALLDLLTATIDASLPDIIYASAHRWRHAFATTVIGKPLLKSEDESVYVGGDWLIGDKAMHAYKSGRAIAADIGTA